MVGEGWGHAWGRWAGGLRGGQGRDERQGVMQRRGGTARRVQLMRRAVTGAMWVGGSTGRKWARWPKRRRMIGGKRHGGGRRLTGGCVQPGLCVPVPGGRSRVTSATGWRCTVAMGLACLAPPYEVGISATLKEPSTARIINLSLQTQLDLHVATPCPAPGLDPA